MPRAGGGFDSGHGLRYCHPADGFLVCNSAYRLQKNADHCLEDAEGVLAAHLQ
jgi:hypothetical protein